jgi:hypothetical protein
MVDTLFSTPTLPRGAALHSLADEDALQQDCYRDPPQPST